MLIWSCPLTGLCGRPLVNPCVFYSEPEHRLESVPGDLLCAINDVSVPPIVQPSVGFYDSVCLCVCMCVQSWDLVEQTQNYLKLLLHIINSDGRLICSHLHHACICKISCCKVTICSFDRKINSNGVNADALTVLMITLWHCWWWCHGVNDDVRVLMMTL